MKLPGKVRSMIDEMGLSSKDKTAVLRHLNDMADSLPEHPTPAEAKRIVDGALKKVGAGKKKDDEKPEEEKKEKKEDKPKEEKKEKVEESRKMTFKAFLSEGASSDTKAVQDLFNSKGLKVKAKFMPGDDSIDDSIDLIAKWKGKGDVSYSIQLAGSKFAANFYDGEDDDFGSTPVGGMSKTAVEAAEKIIAHIEKNKTL